MENKDEIIALQNEIMQGLMNQRMRLIGEDLWGVKAPETPETAPAAAEKTTETTAQAPVSASAQEETPQ